MNAARFGARGVTIVGRARGAADAHGARPFVTVAETAVWAVLQQLTTSEQLTGRDAATSDWLAVITDPTVTVRAGDQLVDGDDVYDVTGAPVLLRDLHGRAHHIEARLRLVEDL